MHISTCELSYSLSSLEAVKCGLAPIPKYGMIVYLRKVEGSTTVYGDTVTYRCLPPYAVIGEETARCTEFGTWTETPECQGTVWNNHHKTHCLIVVFITLTLFKNLVINYNNNTTITNYNI